uniref:DUF4203 domain-containing protein n=1 Tax=Angiostrongylus cantonensis TaxID=6313 RepID=A0A0K0DKT2_ANGCA
MYVAVILCSFSPLPAENNFIFSNPNLYTCMLQLDRWEHGCNISSVVGGLAGIGGGTAVIGGVILMPPVAIAGLAVGGVAAASNLGTALLKMHNLKVCTVLFLFSNYFKYSALEEYSGCKINAR